METRSKKRRRLTEEIQRLYEAETSAYSSLNCSFEGCDTGSNESFAHDARYDQKEHGSSDNNAGDAGEQHSNAG